MKKNEENLKTVSFQIPESLHAKLKLHAKIQQIPLHQLLTEIVKMELRNYDGERWDVL